MDGNGVLRSGGAARRAEWIPDFEEAVKAVEESEYSKVERRLRARCENKGEFGQRLANAQKAPSTTDDGKDITHLGREIPYQRRCLLRMTRRCISLRHFVSS